MIEDMVHLTLFIIGIEFRAELGVIKVEKFAKVFLRKLFH